MIDHKPNIFDMCSEAGVPIINSNIKPLDDELDVFVKIEFSSDLVRVSHVDINGDLVPRMTIMSPEGAEAIAALLMEAARSARELA